MVEQVQQLQFQQVQQLMLVVEVEEGSGTPGLQVEVVVEVMVEVKCTWLEQLTLEVVEVVAGTKCSQIAGTSGGTGGSGIVIIRYKFQ
jgi:hypothetical protein